MKIKIDEMKIVRVDNTNYHLYKDMISWRATGEELEETKKHSINVNHRKELENDCFFVFAAEYDRRFIGWIHILITPKIGKWKKGHLFVDEMWVAPEYRRNGVALKLLSSIDLVKVEAGLDNVRLITDTESARKLYEKYGFNVVNKCVFMEKNL